MCIAEKNRRSGFGLPQPGREKPGASAFFRRVGPVRTRPGGDTSASTALASDLRIENGSPLTPFAESTNSRCEFCTDMKRPSRLAVFLHHVRAVLVAVGILRFFLLLLFGREETNELFLIFQFLVKKEVS